MEHGVASCVSVRSASQPPKGRRLIAVAEGLVAEVVVANPVEDHITQSPVIGESEPRVTRHLPATLRGALAVKLRAPFRHKADAAM